MSSPCHGSVSSNGSPKTTRGSCGAASSLSGTRDGSRRPSRLLPEAPDDFRRRLNTIFLRTCYLDDDEGVTISLLQPHHGDPLATVRTQSRGSTPKRSNDALEAHEKASATTRGLLRIPSTADSPSRIFQIRVRVSVSWWGGRGSNPRPMDYESTALTN